MVKYFIKRPGQPEQEVDIFEFLDAQEDPAGFMSYRRADMLHPDFKGILGRAEVIPDA